MSEEESHAKTQSTQRKESFLSLAYFASLREILLGVLSPFAPWRELFVPEP
jgi:hypothetical protein